MYYHINTKRQKGLSKSPSISFSSSSLVSIRFLMIMTTVGTEGMFLFFICLTFYQLTNKTIDKGINPFHNCSSTTSVIARGKSLLRNLVHLLKKFYCFCRNFMEVLLFLTEISYAVSQSHLPLDCILLKVAYQ